MGPMLSGYAIDAIEPGIGSVDFKRVFYYAGWMVLFYVASSALSYLINVLMTVSYTHLDVYKRQGLDMSTIIEITDFMAPELDVYARMTENQLLNRHEPSKGIFIAESPKVIERALDSGCVPISFLMEKKHVELSLIHIL